MGGLKRLLADPRRRRIAIAALAAAVLVGLILRRRAAQQAAATTAAPSAVGPLTDPSTLASGFGSSGVPADLTSGDPVNGATGPLVLAPGECAYDTLTGKVACAPPDPATPPEPPKPPDPPAPPDPAHPKKKHPRVKVPPKGAPKVKLPKTPHPSGPPRPPGVKRHVGGAPPTTQRERLAAAVTAGKHHPHTRKTRPRTHVGNAHQGAY